MQCAQKFLGTVKMSPQALREYRLHSLKVSAWCWFKENQTEHDMEHQYAGIQGYWKSVHEQWEPDSCNMKLKQTVVKTRQRIQLIYVNEMYQMKAASWQLKWNQEGIISTQWRKLKARKCFSLSRCEGEEAGEAKHIGMSSGRKKTLG